jgi:xanthine dehydrogenase/oxidase
MSLFDFLQIDMKQKLIFALTIPVLPATNKYNSYKMMLRHQNSHAYVNAAFNIAVDTNFIVQSTPTMVFGGIGAYIVAATATANFLNGKDLKNVQNLQNAIGLLRSELVPDTPPGSASVPYRQNLAMGFFYKALLSFLPNLDPAVVSGGQEYIRPVSSGEQTYDSNPALAPVSEPISKPDGIMQTSGESLYLPDHPITPGTLWTAYVLAPLGNATLVKLDLSAVTSAPGVFRVLTAKDLKYGNNSTPAGMGAPERIFVDVGETADYAGQAVAVVLADTQANANAAAKLAVVSATPIGKPIITIADAMAVDSKFDCPVAAVQAGEDITKALAASDHVISGEISCGSQYHFYMETQGTLAVPTDDGGLEVYSSM